MSIDSMVKSIVREHHWSASDIDALFFDDVDYRGLIYWYNDIKEVHRELKQKD